MASLYCCMITCIGSEAYVNLAAEVLKKGNFGGLGSN